MFFKWPDELELAQYEIQQRLLTHNLYYCPTLLDRRRRVKDAVTWAPCAWADLDACDPTNLLVTPSFLIETSPDRYQALWKFGKAIDALEAEDLSHRIAYMHARQGADKSGWNLAKALRVPFTYNRKPEYSMGEADAPPILITSANSTPYTFEDFKSYPQVMGHEAMGLPFPTELPELSAEQILNKYRKVLQPMALILFSTQPDADEKEGWSGVLWRFLMMCFEAGMEIEEVYVVASEAACNKYRRDNRPPELLWRDVCRAFSRNEMNVKALFPASASEGTIELLTDQERTQLEGQESFVERYVSWAKTLGDASWQYHQAGAFVTLSALLAGVVGLPTSFGVIKPNLWFMILADCLAVDTPVLTPTGWKTMEELTTGDLVIGSNGTPTKVEVVSELKHLAGFKVVMQNGTSVVCSEDHLWTVTIKPEKTITVPLRKVREYLSTRRNPRVPLISRPVEFSGSSKLPLDPYLLGVWLAEGCRSVKGTSAIFSSADLDLVENVRKLLPSDLRLVNSGNHDWHVRPVQKWSRNNQVLLGLRDLGLISLYQDERFVPEEYMYSHTEDRVALLQGFMDGDGHVGTTIRAQGTGRRLYENIAEVARSLGFGVTLSKASHTTVTSKPLWRVSLQPPEGINPFRLASKANKVKASHRRRQTIKAIVPLGYAVDMKCIKVAAPDGLYVVKDYIVTHNTTLTRKSTAMDIGVEVVDEIDPDAVLATDGSVEGLMTSLSMRPGKPSIFLRDEFSGLLEQFTKRDYYAGMAETLTKLYDGKMQKRVLRREIIEVRDPCLIVFAGGIKNKVLGLLNFDNVSSGFIPRFVFITAESDIKNVRPLGPPTEQNLGARLDIVSELTQMYQHYNVTQTIDLGTRNNLVTKQPRKWEAKLTSRGWELYNRLETDMMKMALRMEHSDLMTPTYDRLCKSGLKAAVLLAAQRQTPQDFVAVTELDLLQAIHFVEQWKVHTDIVLANIGKTNIERELDRVLGAITRTPGIARSVIMQRYHLQARDTSRILETLEQRGLITRQPAGRTEKLFPISVTVRSPQ